MSSHNHSDKRELTTGFRFNRAFKKGAKAGLKTTCLLLAIVVPVSFTVTLLGYLGVLEHAARWVAPVFETVGLPRESAISVISGALVNCYSAIAAMGPIALTDREVTIFALVVLFFHNIPVEVPVQKKAGSAIWAMILIRLVAAVAGALFLNAVLPADPGPAHPRGMSTDAITSFDALLAAWAKGAGWLIGKIVALVMGLTVIQKVLDEFGLVSKLALLLAPLLFLLGLSRRTAFLWTVVNTLGLAYGAAVIWEEVDSGRITKEEARRLNVSAALCHSLLEDTLLFVAVGASAIWITVPRIVAAAIAVWGYRLIWRRPITAPLD